MPLVTIVAPKMRLKFFQVDQCLEMCASAASHNIGARNAIGIYSSRQRLEMLRVPLVTILAREVRLKFF